MENERGKGSFVFETKSKEKNFISEKYFVERYWVMGGLNR